MLAAMLDIRDLTVSLDTSRDVHGCALVGEEIAGRKKRSNGKVKTLGAAQWHLSD